MRPAYARCLTNVATGNSMLRYIITAMALLESACAPPRTIPERVPSASGARSTRLPVDLDWRTRDAWSDTAHVEVHADRAGGALVVSGDLPAPTKCGNLHAVAERDVANQVLLTLSRQPPSPGYGCFAIAGSYGFTAWVKSLPPNNYRVRVHYLYYRDDKTAQIDTWAADKMVSVF